MQEHKLAIGTVLAERYEITGIIARGGMSVIYRAADLRLPGKQWALKWSNHTTGKEFAVHEAQMLMRLSHPKLPLLVDYGFDEQRLLIFYVMEWIHGETLQAAAARMNFHFSFEEAIAVVKQLADALHYLHNQPVPIIHRDLKPSNVMLMQDRTVKLIDFGIARYYKDVQAEDTCKLGTPGFASPEQHGSAQSGPESDVYGLGALLYWMLSEGRTYKPDRPIAPRELHASTPAAFVQVLEQMLDKRPAYRFRTMDALKQALVGFGTSGLSELTPAKRSVRRPERHSAASGQIVVAALASGSGATFITLTLAHVLAARGICCSGIEHPAHPPEWHALLPMNGMYGKSVYENSMYSVYQPPGEKASLNLFAHRIGGGQQNRLEALAAYDAIKLRSQHQFTLIDISSHWHAPEGMHLLGTADICLLVADPSPARWQRERLSALQRLQEERLAQGLPTWWIANKDAASFAFRREWLAMLPGQALCLVPQLDPASWCEVQWRTRWATDVPKWRKQLTRQLEPLVRKLT